MSQDSRAITVPFHGDEILCVETPDGVFVAVKPLCEAAGLDFSAQRKKLMADQELFGVALIAIPSASGTQETVCIPVTRIAAWLFMLQPVRVKPELRAKVALYRLEAADVLDQHFRGLAEEKVEEIRQLRGQLGHCHSNLRAALPKWGQLLALNETGTYGMPVMAARVGLTQDRTYTEFQAIQRCGMLLPDKVADNTAPSWLSRITELERQLAFERDQRQAEARNMSVARYRAQRDGLAVEDDSDQPSLFGDDADV